MPSRNTTWVATSAGPQPELGHDRGLDGRVDVGVGADRPGQLADRDRVPGPDQPVPAAGHREREVGDPVPPDVRLGVDAVRPARPAACCAVRQRVLAQRRDEPGGPGDQQVGGLGQLQRQRGVQQVGGRHPVVHAGRGRARGGVVRPGGQERDHVVVGHRLHRGDCLRGRRRQRRGPRPPTRPARCRPWRAPPARGSPPGTRARTCGPRSRPGPSRAACSARSHLYSPVPPGLGGFPAYPGLGGLLAYPGLRGPLVVAVAEMDAPQGGPARVRPRMAAGTI